MNPVLGIDPGVKGGLAVLAANGAPLHVRAFRPDMTHLEIVQEVKAAALILTQYGGYDCYIEKVGFKKGDGGQGAFTFGQINGLLRGSAWAVGLVVHDVAPMLWQARLNCLTGGNKNVSKNKALELFEGRGFKITHAVADALLIAEFGRRSNEQRRA